MPRLYEKYGVMPVIKDGAKEPVSGDHHEAQARKSGVNDFAGDETMTDVEDMVDVAAADPPDRTMGERP